MSRLEERSDLVIWTTRDYSGLLDVLALTKVNFNTCLFNEPVTIRFANAIGDGTQGKRSQ